MTRANTRHYESMGEFLASLDAPAVWNQSDSTNQSRTGNLRFTETDSYKEATRLALDGWPKGRDMMTRSVAEIKALRSLVTHRAQGLDAGGAFPDIREYVAGNPCHMVTIGDEERKTRPIVRFRVSIIASAGVKALNMMLRGAAIVSWVDALEGAGIRCEIVAECALLLGGVANGPTITIKRADDPVNLDTLAYALIHPSMSRRHCFAWCERYIPAEHQSGNYGIPTDFAPPNDAIEVYFPRMFLGKEWTTAESSLANVKAQIDKLALGDAIDRAA